MHSTLYDSEYSYDCVFFFFFQAEDGIRDLTVTGVQTWCSSDLELDFRGARRPVGHAARERLGHGREHRRVRMPGDQGTPGADQVEVGAAIGVEQLRARAARDERSEEHTSELQSQSNLVCRLLLDKR